MHTTASPLPRTATRRRGAARQRPDRRRRPVVHRAPAAWPYATRRFSAPHRLARSGPGGCRAGGTTRTIRAPLARPPRPCGALSGAGRKPAQCRCHHCRYMARAGWSAQGERDEILGRFRAGMWQASARELLARRIAWRTWALYDRAPLAPLGQRPDHYARRRRPSDAAFSRPGRRDGDRGRGGAGRLPGQQAPTMRRRMRRYELLRKTAPAARANERPASRNGRIYHMAGAEGLLRNTALRMHGRRAPAQPVTTGSMAGNRAGAMPT